MKTMQEKNVMKRVSKTSYYPFKMRARWYESLGAPRTNTKGSHSVSQAAIA